MIRLNQKIFRGCSRYVSGSLACFSLVACSMPPEQNRVFESERLSFTVSELATGLDHPWGMAFLPGGDILVTERSGDLRLVRQGELLEQPVSGLPEIDQVGQGGLLGIALHPDFADNQLVYLSYAGAGDGGHSTEVMRGRLAGTELREVETIFRAEPKTSGGRHFGSRLVFAEDGTLYVSLGDRGASPSLCEDHPAQQLDSHTGSLVRLHDDGSVPADNPHVAQAGARPEIYTHGNRNMQGMAINPVSGEIWTHEHGPQGGDEINVMRAGGNYGWPVITYGANYGTGSKICTGTRQAGMQQPVYYWVPSIAPSGMSFYTGDALPGWQGNLFVGSLKFGLLVRLELDGDRVVHEERLLDGAFGRIRDVQQGPDGRLYLLTDEGFGSLLRIDPVN